MSSLCSVRSRRACVPSRSLVIGVGLVALVALVLCGTIDPLQSGLLTMVPALAVAVMMFARPYLGERVIARLRARRRSRNRRSVSARQAAPVRRCARVARGGRLIAVALAGRAPPPALAGC
jgi:hypothetical protein